MARHARRHRRAIADGRRPVGPPAPERAHARHHRRSPTAPPEAERSSDQRRPRPTRRRTSPGGRARGGPPGWRGPRRLRARATGAGFAAAATAERRSHAAHGWPQRRHVATEGVVLCGQRRSRGGRAQTGVSHRLMRIGVIGLVTIGQTYLAALHKLRVDEILGVDVSSAARERAQPYTLRCLAHYRDLLEIDGLDGVVIATPPRTHRDIAL